MSFDLQAQIATDDRIGEPAGYAVVRLDSPVREEWLRYFGDHAPLVENRVAVRRAPQGESRLVFISIDHLDATTFGRLVAAHTSKGDWTPAEREVLAGVLRNQRTYVMIATGVVVAPTLALARALAATPLDPETN